MNIGRHLRESRERRGMTLRAVADSTKLSTTVLEQIERNDFRRLAGGIYAKGYLRAYAEAVGVDADEVVREFVAQLPPEIVVEPSQALVIDFALEHRRALAATALSIVVTITAFGMYVGSRGDLRGSDIADTTDAIQPMATDVLPIESLSPADVPTLNGDLVLALEIQPLGPCWVSATSDGELVLYKLLQAGERVTIEARNEVVLRVGNPEQFSYTLNGASGRPLGDGSRPVTVTITDSNYQMFLAEPEPERVAAVTA